MQRNFFGNPLQQRMSQRMQQRSSEPTATELQATGTVATSGSNLNLRSEPSQSAEIIGTIPNGSTLAIYGTIGNYYIVGYDNMVGYASKDYIRVSPNVPEFTAVTMPAVGDFRYGAPSTRIETQIPHTTAMVSAGGSNLNIRTEPSIDSRVIGQIPDGDSIVIIESVPSGWYLAQYDGMRGYVNADYITF